LWSTALFRSGAVLCLSRSAVSKYVIELGQELRAQLLNRTTPAQPKRNDGDLIKRRLSEQGQLK